MMGIVGLLIVGLIFFLVFRFGLEGDFNLTGSGGREQENLNTGEEKNSASSNSQKTKSKNDQERAHPLRDKFSSKVSDEELIEMGRRRMESGQITREEFEEFRENIKS